MDVQLSISKINNHTVKPVKKRGEGKKLKPVKGEDLFSLYCNIFICSRKFSGKTTLIYNIIEKTCTKNTTIIFFVSTIHKDDTYEAILKMCDKKNITYCAYTSLYDDDLKDVDRLAEMVKHLKDKKIEPETALEKTKAEKSATYDLFEDGPIKGEGKEDQIPDDEDKAKKISRSKWRVPEYFFIFDDLSLELKHSNSVVSLLKDSRHLHAKVLISSQAWTDIPKNARGQFDYYILYKGVPTEKLEDIYEEAALSTLTFKQFEKIYHTATEKRFSFLYIDKNKESFRQNLDTSIKVIE